MPLDVSWQDLSAQMIPCVHHSTAENGPARVWLPGQGHGQHGGFSMLNISEWPNAAAVCSLSQILETEPIPHRYYLSAKAANGIIRRAGKRGKELPSMLRLALSAVAGVSNELEKPEDKTLLSPSDSGGGNTSGPIDVATALSTSNQRLDFDTETMIAHSLRAEGYDASEDGTGRGTPIVPVACYGISNRPTPKFGEDICPSLDAKTSGGGRMEAVAIQAGALRENPNSGPDGAGFKVDCAYTLEARAEVQAVAFDMRGREGGAQFEGPHDTANMRAASGGSSRSYVADQWAVRRLTPTECSRLQGFPDDHCRITYRGKAAADGPIYKALGNSWAVPCGGWIIGRIAERATA